MPTGQRRASLTQGPGQELFGPYLRTVLTRRIRLLEQKNKCVKEENRVMRKRFFLINQVTVPRTFCPSRKKPTT